MSERHETTDPFDLFDESEREEIRARITLMNDIAEHLKTLKKTQAEIARQLDIQQPRVSALMNGHAEQFTLDCLCRYAAVLGFGVNINLVQKNAA